MQTGHQIGNRIVWSNTGTTSTTPDAPTELKPSGSFEPFLDDMHGGSSVVDITAGGGVVFVRKGMQFVRDRATVKITNRKKQWTMKYKVGLVNLIGGWEDMTPITLTPGKFMVHTANQQDFGLGGKPDTVIASLTWVPYDPSQGESGRGMFDALNWGMLGTVAIIAGVAGAGYILWKKGVFKKLTTRTSPTETVAVETNRRRRRR